MHWDILRFFRLGKGGSFEGPGIWSGCSFGNRHTHRDTHVVASHASDNNWVCVLQFFL